MAKIKIDELIIGKEYSAVQLAEMWGYADHHALITGIVTPKGTNKIILFVTKQKQSGATPYIDEMKGNMLYMQGQEKHGTDRRLYANINSNQDGIYLFYREKHHTPFIYYGRAYLIDAKISTDKPSEFYFLIENMRETEDDMSIMDTLLNSNNKNDNFTISIEGAKKIRQHITYERNPKNRMNAIKIHGHVCKICGFDFNKFYGQDLADNFIEIHHIKELSQGEQEVDPSKDLIPVCANCHRMLHKRKINNASTEELKSRININQKHNN